MLTVIVWLVVGGNLAWLASLVMPTQQDGVQAGVALGEMRD
jgi:uncharacterized membrane protein YeaQ/YmgE (transglycosylase-associated protein family)